MGDFSKFAVRHHNLNNGHAFRWNIHHRQERLVRGARLEPDGDFPVIGRMAG